MRSCDATGTFRLSARTAVPQSCNTAAIRSSFSSLERFSLAIHSRAVRQCRSSCGTNRERLRENRASPLHEFTREKDRLAVGEFRIRRGRESDRARAKGRRVMMIARVPESQHLLLSHEPRYPARVPRVQTIRMIVHKYWL